LNNRIRRATYLKSIAAVTGAFMILRVLLWTGPLEAAGLRIEPGGLLIRDVPVGETRSIVESSGITFVVYNRDDIAHRYRISAHRPSEAGNGRWPKGYCEIPEASWVVPVPEVIEIPADSSASFDVLIKVPDDGGLYNRKWAVTLAVESARVGGKNVALALYPLLQIETKTDDLRGAGPD
jgi:hypothetical protein